MLSPTVFCVTPTLFCVMALSSFNTIIIMNNQVTVTATTSSLPCQAISTHRMMLRPFTFLDYWFSPVVFHCPICLFIILCLIFILYIIVIHVHCHISFIGCCNIHIIIHIGNCPTKKILI
ncbi:hypothetical protein AMTRI_Chr13g84860 [Amborella trichopoda]